MKKIKNTVVLLVIIIHGIAGQTMTTSLTSYGLQAGTQAPESVFFGYRAGSKDTSGFNSFIGHLSGWNSTSGSSNTFLGVFAGHANVSGASNTFLGSYTGNSNTSGNENTYIGESSGQYLKGSRNICIGNNAGPVNQNTNLSDRLFIDITKNDNPLIYGEFNPDLVRINGSFEAMGAISQSSSREVKCNILGIDQQVILAKLMTVPIQTWSYVSAPEDVHIGPMSQDFYKAFRFGKDDVSIATVDSDGIALAAIQALKLENDELRSIVNQLKERLTQIESKL